MYLTCASTKSVVALPLPNRDVTDGRTNDEPPAVPKVPVKGARNGFGGG